VLVGAASTATVLLRFAFPGVPAWVWEPTLLVGVAALGFAFFAVGVRSSTRITLIVETVAVALIVAIMTILLVTNWGVVPPIVPTAFDPAAVGAGAAMAVGLFVGFETSATLGAEARRPFRDVPRSFILTVIIAAAIFLLSFAGQYAGLGVVGEFTAVGDIDPTVSTASPLLVVVWDLGIVLSYLAAFVASLNGVIRLTFTLGKDGLLPTTLSRVNSRNRLPMRAAVAVTSSVLFAAVGASIVSGSPQLVVGAALTTSAIGCGLAYAIACLLLPRFRRRIGEPLLVASVAAIAVGVAIVVVLICFVWWNFATESLAILIPLVAIAALWAAFWITARLRGSAARLGTYDQTSLRELVPAGVDARFEATDLGTTRE
jgi:amino acid transporter